MIEEIEVRKERVREGKFNGEDGKWAREERKWEPQEIKREEERRSREDQEEKDRMALEGLFVNPLLHKIEVLGPTALVALVVEERERVEI